MKISLFVEINKLTIEYTVWNSRRCNIFFTVWWSTYRKINAYTRNQNDNNDNFDSMNVLISDVQLLLLDCRRKQRRSIIITWLSSRTATLKSCARRSSTISRDWKMNISIDDESAKMISSVPAVKILFISRFRFCRWMRRSKAEYWLNRRIFWQQYSSFHNS
jgi:hypothetical protein